MAWALCLAATVTAARALQAQNDALGGVARAAVGLPPNWDAGLSAHGKADTEDSCQLLSVRGLELSCDVHPKHPVSEVSGDEARSIMSHYAEEMRSRGDGTSVYVSTTALPIFVKEILPHVVTTFRLVTGDADKGPLNILDQVEFQRLANDTRLLVWFAQNCADGEVAHPKVEPVPIGLDYHSLWDNWNPSPLPQWGYPSSPKNQERVLLDVRRSAPPFAARDSMVYMNGGWSGRARVRDMQLMLRQPELVEVQSAHLQREQFWEAVAKHKFSASPPGNGVDCHRTWEIIALGGIPLVDSLLQSLYERSGFNVVLLEVDEWENLSTPVVQAKMQDALARRTDSLPPAMYLRYWLDRIRGL